MLSSYRLIALQNVYGKLLENIVTRKIVLVYLETEGTLLDNLGVYHPGKITRGSTGAFTYGVYKVFQHKTEAAAVTLDLDYA